MRSEDYPLHSTLLQGGLGGYGLAEERDPLIDFARRWWWLLLIGVTLGIGGAVAYSRFGPTTYQTSALIQIPAQQTQFDPTEKADKARSATVNYAAEAASPRTFELAAAALEGPLGLNTTDLIRMKRTGEITIKAVDNANFIEITVIDSDPDRAQVIADTFAIVIVDDVNGRTGVQATDQRTRLEEQIAFTRERLVTAQLFLREQELEAEIRDQRGMLLSLQSGFQQEVERQAESDRQLEAPFNDEPVSNLSATRVELQRILGEQITEVEGNIENLGTELDEVRAAIEASPASTDASTSAAFASAYQLELSGLTSQYVAQQVAALTATPPLNRYGVASTPLPIQAMTKLALFGIVIGGGIATGIAFMIDRWRDWRRRKNGTHPDVATNAELERLLRTLHRVELERAAQASNGSVSEPVGARDTH